MDLCRGGGIVAVHQGKSRGVDAQSRAGDFSGQRRGTLYPGAIGNLTDNGTGQKPADDAVGLIAVGDRGKKLARR